MSMFTGMSHIHLKVHDVDRAVAFYRDGLGMAELMTKHDGQMVILGTPDAGDVLTLSKGAIGVDVDSLGEPGDNGGIDHFGFGLANHDDFDAAVAHLIDAGATLLHQTELAPGWPTAFLRDPEGYAFQI